MVREFEPCVGLRTDSAKPAWDSLSLSLSKQINLKKKNKKEKKTTTLLDCRNWQADSISHTEMQKTQHGQKNIEKEQ